MGLDNDLLGVAGNVGGNGGIKSLIIDKTTPWQSENLQGVRSFELMNGATPTPMINGVDFVAYGNYWVAIGPSAQAFAAFDTSLSKIGHWIPNQWLILISDGSGGGDKTRIICVYNDLQTFDGIRFNNHHATGGNTLGGIKDCKIYTSPSEITDIIYGNPIADGTLIFNGVLPIHPPANVVQDYMIPLI